MGGEIVRASGSDDNEESAHGSPFEAIRREDARGGEYWSARDLAKVLGYQTNYRNFKTVIAKAQEACANSGQAVTDHFADARNMIATGKGAQRAVEDVQLSRYACYLIVQNADPTKPIVALGQTYFAVQTRRQELTDELAGEIQGELAGMTEDQKRLFVRRQLAEHNTKLAAVAREAGVIEPRDYAIFQDHGYMGLYAGERTRDIHRRKGLGLNQRILDYMGFDELAANLFRASMAEQHIRREEIQGTEQANRAHYTVGHKVRQTMAELGATMPEDLPTPAESIQQLEQQQKRQQLQGTQLSMFPANHEPETR